MRVHAVGKEFPAKIRNCVVPENIQTPTTEGISNRTPPPPPLRIFHFHKETLTPPPPLWNFHKNIAHPPYPLKSFFLPLKGFKSWPNTKSKGHVSIGIYFLIHFGDNPKAVINGAINWLKKLKNWEIISSYKFLTKLTCCVTSNEHDRQQTAILRSTR